MGCLLKAFMSQDNVEKYIAYNQSEYSGEILIQMSLSVSVIVLYLLCIIFRNRRIIYCVAKMHE